MNVTDSRLCLTATSKLRYGERIGTGVGSLLPCLAQLSRSVSCLRVCLRNSAERAGGSNVDSRAAVPSTPFLLPRRGVATETGPARIQQPGVGDRCCRLRAPCHLQGFDWAIAARFDAYAPWAVNDAIPHARCLQIPPDGG